MRIARERAQREAQLEEEGSHMLALTFTDEGPDVESEHNRLWMSHEDFQEINHGSAFRSEPPTLPVDTIFEGASRLRHPPTNASQPPFPATAVPPSFSSTTPEPPSSLSLLNGFEQLSLNENVPILPPSPSNDRDTCRLQKKEDNRHTKRAMEILDAIASEADTSWARRASDCIPTNGELSEMESTVARLRSAFERVTRITPSLLDRKRAVLESLNRLEAYTLEWRLVVPNDTPGPVKYNCGMFVQMRLLTCTDLQTQTITMNPQLTC